MILDKKPQDLIGWILTKFGTLLSTCLAYIKINKSDSQCSQLINIQIQMRLKVIKSSRTTSRIKKEPIILICLAAY